MERAGLQLPLVWVRELYSQTAYFSPRWEASQGCLPEEGAASFVAAILFDAGAHCIKVKFWREVSRLLKPDMLEGVPTNSFKKKQ